MVETPARDTAVASQRERVSTTRSDRDKVTLDAVGRRLAVVVASPARDIAVAS